MAPEPPPPIWQVHQLIFKQADPGQLSDPNSFRRRHCYGGATALEYSRTGEDVDLVLRDYEAPLRLVFSALNQADLGVAATLLSLFEYMTFLRTIGLIGHDVTERGARPRD